MNPTDPRLVTLTLTYLDGHCFIEQHELVPDDHPRLPLDGPQLHTVLAYPAREVDPTQLPPQPRFDGDRHPALATLLIAPTCEMCLPVEGAIFAVGLGLHDVLGATRIVPICANHADVRPTLGIDTLSGWTGAQVLWGELTDAFVIDVLAASEHHRGVVPSPIEPKRRYAHELARGETAAVFADHLRVDADGGLWLPTWARIVPGLPGVDVPISRGDDGGLRIDLSQVALARPLALMPDEPGDFVLPVTQVGVPTAPAGHDSWIAAGPDHAAS